MNTFDPETHQYTIDGRPVPSVTTVLKEAGIIDASFYTPFAAERGTFVHQACALYDKDELDMQTLDPALSPYVKAWAKFRRQINVEMSVIEHPYYSPQYGFAGTIDRAWVEDARFVVCDIKSGAMPKWLPLQLAGYSILIDAYSGMGVQLKDNGTYSVTVINTVGLFKARRLFLQALETVKTRRKEYGREGENIRLDIGI